MLEILVLGSGSSGNCVYVGTEKTSVLIDAGISLKLTREKLSRFGLDISDVKALLISHEHHDHILHAERIALERSIPLYLSHLLPKSLIARKEGIIFEEFKAGRTFTIEDLEILPLSVPHDARDPVGFLIANGRTRVGVFTDLGLVTPQLLSAFRECSALVIEANHDEDLLLKGPYPPFLKARVGGPNGHLSNKQTARALASIASDRLKSALLAHLSRTNNTPNLALLTVNRYLEKCDRNLSLFVCGENGSDKPLRVAE